jgi:acetyl-CoA carboxylase carboxyl transferase subunit alpha
LTAASLRELEVIDEIIEEPAGGAHHRPEETLHAVKQTLLKHLKKLSGVSASRLVHRRFEKYSRMGMFTK